MVTNSNIHIHFDLHPLPQSVLSPRQRYPIHSYHRDPCNYQRIDLQKYRYCTKYLILAIYPRWQTAMHCGAIDSGESYRISAPGPPTDAHGNFMPCPNGIVRSGLRIFTHKQKDERNRNE